MSALPRLKADPRLQTPFAADVMAGLAATPKRLPPKYFYDAEGARLFERITTLPEYYPTRVEIDLLERHAGEIAAFIADGATLIEFGSGSSTKTRILLRAAQHVAAYVPVDICAECLEEQAARLKREFPKLEVAPVIADFAAPFDLPPGVPATRRVGFFPGSTIGNLEPHEASAFLTRVGRLLGDGGVLIVGVDLIKDPAILHAAYNDAAGVTAQFNLNVLARINRELGADFDLRAFEHHAFFNREQNRIEMHLASLRRQKVRIGAETYLLRAGETIHTENSYKYTAESFGALARGCGWTPVKVWTDDKHTFSIHALRREQSPPRR
jgi:dimethylhistidine N-methyltransferase